MHTFGFGLRGIHGSGGRDVVEDGNDEDLDLDLDRKCVG